MGYFDDLSCLKPGHEDVKNLEEKDLASFELKNNLRLPEDYKNLMLRMNGGDVRFDDYANPFCYFRTIDSLGLRTAPMVDSFESLEFINEFSLDLAQEDKMPPHLLIIGRAGDTTCYLCLGISGEAFGKVYTWMTSEFTDHWFDYDLDMPYTERGEVRDRSEKIADSIRELLDGLCREDEAKAWAPNEFPE